MKENPYKHLPPLEHRPDGTPYRMTLAQRKQANALIRRECCNCADSNCIALDDGDTCTCPQMVSFLVCCKWFRWAVLPPAGTLEVEIYQDRDLKRCAVCGGVFVPKSNRAKYCPDCAAGVHRRQKTESERKRRRSTVDS
ncbi:MAG: cysteine-rich VLP domain-containing protein [Blautia sp.]|nr:cysteine-rich VLP domain-containing protein [Blautia sp.]MCM1199795.1 cysteine-rich VLP domain-containing protein [Bacteroides fragilis]